MKEIFLTQGMIALVDNIDYDYLSKNNWHTLKNKNSTFYAKRDLQINNKVFGILMHREIIKRMGLIIPKDYQVDHKNGNGLHNWRDNLRVVTESINRFNSKIRSHNTSGYRGVSWYKNYLKWVAHISINKRRINLGYFDNIDDAIEARRQGELKYYEK